MNAPSRIAAGAPALSGIGLVLAVIAAWLAFGFDQASLEHLRRDLPYGWLFVLGRPAAAVGIGLLAVAAWLGAGWLLIRARRA